MLIVLRHKDTDFPREVPDSHRVKEQKRNLVFKQPNGKLCVELRYDDQCGNGYNTFSITGELWDYARHRNEPITCGCIHDEIAKLTPHLAKYTPWHLVSSSGPMHYLDNTIYHADARDRYGLLKGEVKHIKNGKTGELCWVREESEQPKYLDGPVCPDPVLLKYVPLTRIGVGRERGLDAARSIAVWPDATDEELSVETMALADRLPNLMREFKAAMLELGFEY